MSSQRPKTQQNNLTKHCKDLVEKRAVNKEKKEIMKVKTLTAKLELAQYYLRKYDIRATDLEIKKLTEKQLLMHLETRWQLEKEKLAAIKL